MCVCIPPISPLSFFPLSSSDPPLFPLQCCSCPVGRLHSPFYPICPLPDLFSIHLQLSCLFLALQPSPSHLLWGIFFSLITNLLEWRRRRQQTLLPHLWLLILIFAPAVPPQLPLLKLRLCVFQIFLFPSVFWFHVSNYTEETSLRPRHSPVHSALKRPALI